MRRGVCAQCGLVQPGPLHGAAAGASLSMQTPHAVMAVGCASTPAAAQVALPVPAAVGKGVMLEVTGIPFSALCRAAWSTLQHPKQTSTALQFCQTGCLCRVQQDYPGFVTKLMKEWLAAQAKQ